MNSQFHITQVEKTSPIGCYFYRNTTANSKVKENIVVVVSIKSSKHAIFIDMDGIVGYKYEDERKCCRLCSSNCKYCLCYMPIIYSLCSCFACSIFARSFFSSLCKFSSVSLIRLFLLFPSKTIRLHAYKFVLAVFFLYFWRMYFLNSANSV